MRSLLRKFFVFNDRAMALLMFAPALFTRVVVGCGFYFTGKGKWSHIDHVVDFFTSLHIPHPEIQARVVATLELAGGICIVLGLFTRFFAAGLSTTMLVALMTADHDDIVNAIHYVRDLPVPDNWDKVPTDVTSFAYLAFLLWLVFYGAGKVSLDYLFGRFLRRAVGIIKDDPSH